MAIRKTKSKTGAPAYRPAVWDPQKQKTVYGRTTHTLRDAKQEEAALIKEVRDGTAGRREDVTVQEVYKRWIAVYASQGHADRTLKSHRYMWEHYLKTTFGRLRVRSVRRAAVVEWRTRMAAQYAAETVNKAVSTLALVFGFAVTDLEVIESSPIGKGIRCTVKPTAHSTWTEEQIAVFLGADVVRGSRYYPMLCLSCVCGMRPGEVCGIRCQDLTQSGVTLVHGISSSGVVTDLKTSGSHRTIALPSWLMDELEKTKGDRTDGWLFLTEKGAPVRPDVLSKQFIRLTEKVRQKGQILPKIRLYDVRHSFATNLLMDGAKSKLVSEVMGNSVATMEHHYAHLRETMLAELLEGYGKKLRGE